MSIWWHIGRSHVTNSLRDSHLPKSLDSPLHITAGKFWHLHFIKCEPLLSSSFGYPTKLLESPLDAQANTLNPESLVSISLSVTSTQSGVIPPLWSNALRIHSHMSPRFLPMYVSKVLYFFCWVSYFLLIYSYLGYLFSPELAEMLS